MKWKTIPSAPSYEASDYGLVRRKDTKHVNRPCVVNGYLSMSLWENGSQIRKYVHRAVCEAFYGAPPKGDIHAAHHNGDRADNRAENLSWKSRKANERDKIRHGKSNHGARNGMAKLTVTEVARIKIDLQNAPLSTGGVKFKKYALPNIARKYGVSSNCIRQIADGTRWSNV